MNRTARFEYIPNTLMQALDDVPSYEVKGKVLQVVGTIVRASVPGVKVGEICILRNSWEDLEILAEVVGFAKGEVLLTALGRMQGISTLTEVIPTHRVHRVGVGPDLLGHVVDGLGRPIDTDTKGVFYPETYYPVFADPPNPLERRVIKDPLPLGVRAIDSMLTCGEGQRLGIFAAAGGGKSTLMAQIVRNTQAEVLGEEGMRKSVVVCSTSDRSSMERLKSAYVATAIAEYFRDKGKKVLLLMDSVTRFGRAQREIGLAAGEPPTRRGFPPSVFTELPKLMERAGNSSKGSITALYTVLVEGDDMTEPIADETRSILDGHIILSRKLAQQHHYPAIDVMASVSRCMPAIVTKEHSEAADKARKLLAKYAEIEMLLQIGEYKQGSDAAADEAIAKNKQINDFLCQGLFEKVPFDETINKLMAIV